VEICETGTANEVERLVFEGFEAALLANNTATVQALAPCTYVTEYLRKNIGPLEFALNKGNENLVQLFIKFGKPRVEEKSFELAELAAQHGMSYKIVLQMFEEEKTPNKMMKYACSHGHIALMYMLENRYSFIKFDIKDAASPGAVYNELSGHYQPPPIRKSQAGRRIPYGTQAFEIYEFMTVAIANNQVKVIAALIYPEGPFMSKLTQVQRFVAYSRALPALRRLNARDEYMVAFRNMFTEIDGIGEQAIQMLQRPEFDSIRAMYEARQVHLDITHIRDKTQTMSILPKDIRMLVSEQLLHL